MSVNNRLTLRLAGVEKRLGYQEKCVHFGRWKTGNAVEMRAQLVGRAASRRRLLDRARGAEKEFKQGNGRFTCVDRSTARTCEKYTAMMPSVGPAMTSTYVRPRSGISTRSALLPLRYCCVSTELAERSFVMSTFVLKTKESNQTKRHR